MKTTETNQTEAVCVVATVVVFGMTIELYKWLVRQAVDFASQPAVQIQVAHVEPSKSHSLAVTIGR